MTPEQISRDLFLDVLKYGFSHEWHKEELKETLAEIQRQVCPICVKLMRGSKINLDHFVPKSQGGEYRLGNLMATHMRCNNRRGNKKPSETHEQMFNALNKKIASILMEGKPIQWTNHQCTKETTNGSF